MPCFPSVGNRSIKDHPGGLPGQAGFEVSGLRGGKQASRRMADAVSSHTGEVTAVCVQEHQGEDSPQGEKSPL